MCSHIATPLNISYHAYIHLLKNMNVQAQKSVYLRTTFSHHQNVPQQTHTIEMYESYPSGPNMYEPDHWAISQVCIQILAVDSYQQEGILLTQNHLTASFFVESYVIQPPE